jgi:hypothetical protein
MNRIAAAILAGFLMVCATLVWLKRQDAPVATPDSHLTRVEHPITPDDVQLTTGYDLASKCLMKGPDYPSHCYGYIIGATETLIGAALERSEPLPFCPQKGIMEVDLVGTVVKFLQNHAEERQNKAPESVRLALASAFPCQKN